jgi:regulator of sirC expression with transglutaminase-like and TPR domain
MDPLAAIGCQNDADIRLDEAALHLAAADRPKADLRDDLTLLARYGRRLPSSLQTAPQRAAALALLLAETEGFTGDSEDYDSPRNADLISVLARRRGMPIALAVLYVGVARRAGWNARVLALPGHVLAAIEGDTSVTLIDAFAGGRAVEPAELPSLATTLARGQPLRSGDAALLSNRETLVRLVMNQASRARQSGDIQRALTLYRRLTLVAPGMPALWWERARLEQLSSDTDAARRSLAAMRETTRDPALSDRIRQAYEALAR